MFLFKLQIIWVNWLYSSGDWILGSIARSSDGLPQASDRS